MGGKNAMIVMDDADLDLAVEGSVWGAFGTSGQRCTASSRLIVHKKVYKKLADRLVERARNLRVGNGLDERPTSVPSSTTPLDKIMSYIDIGQHEDKATLACGGNAPTKGEFAQGLLLSSRPSLPTLSPACGSSRKRSSGRYVVIPFVDA